MRIINLDWFQGCFKPIYFDKHVWNNKYEVKLLPYQTRHFRKVEEIFIDGLRFCTACSLPHSGVIDSSLIMIKFDNRFLYDGNFYKLVLDFLSDNNLRFNNITRLDICCDFDRLYMSKSAEKFIKQFVSGKLLKVGKYKFACNGITDGVNTFHALKFGTGTSDFTYQLYNKSKELNEVKMKPWIIDSWRNNGCADESKVWRLEFAISNTAKELVNQATGEVLQFNSMMNLNREYFEAIFWALFNKYWKFTYNDGKSRKDRMREYIFFDEWESDNIVQDCSKLYESNRADKIFAKKLFTINEQLRGNDKELSIKLKQVQDEFINSRYIVRWANEKGIRIREDNS